MNPVSAAGQMKLLEAVRKLDTTTNTVPSRVGLTGQFGAHGGV